MNIDCIRVSFTDGDAIVRSAFTDLREAIAFLESVAYEQEAIRDHVTSGDENE